MDRIKDFPLPPETILYIAGGILVLGIILGFFKKITVYRDFKDLGTCFLLLFLPIGIGALTLQFASANENFKSIIKWTMLSVDIILLIWIFIQTYKDNSNIFATLLAFYVKIILGVLFSYYLLQFILPGGKTKHERRKSRATAGAILLMLSPIIFGLVHNKVWSYKADNNQ